MTAAQNEKRPIRLSAVAQRRISEWSRMTSKQKLADMEKEDRRRKKMLRASGANHLEALRFGAGLSADSPNLSTHKPHVACAAAQPLYHERGAK